MEGIVFVPGIFGSQLYYNNNGATTQIWPPGPEDLGGYTQRDFDELSDPARVSVGNIVDYIAFPFIPGNRSHPPPDQGGGSDGLGWRWRPDMLPLADGT